MTYDDGKEETLNAGAVFYMPPGHTTMVEQDDKLNDFSPKQEFVNVVAHIENKITTIQQQQGRCKKRHEPI